MALDDTFNVTRPGQTGATGDIHAQHIVEYTGIVESTIARKSVMSPRVPIRTVKGTSTFQNFGVGESTLQKLVPGQAPDGTVNKFGKLNLTIDTVVLARSVFPLLETFQTSYDSRKEVGQEHGKKIAKFYDQSFFIQALKTGALTDTVYQGLTGGGTGHLGASQIVQVGANDNLDPAKLYSNILDLCTKLEEKDVDPQTDDVMLAVRPAEFNVLLQNEQLIDTTYITSEGNKISGPVLRARGVPVVSSNNLPAGQVISGHLLSNPDNGNAYDGDFTKVVLGIFSPRALMAGQTIPLKTGVFWDDVYKHWYVDAWLAYAVGPNRPEFSGLITKP